MPDQPVRITFEPEERTAHVLKDTKIIEASARAGLTINTPCGGAGTCGKCRVQMTTGATEPGPSDRAHFNETALAQGWRLACQTALQADSTVAVPETSRLSGQHQIITESMTTGVAAVSPTVRKIYVELPVPTMEDNAPDLIRLERAIGPFTPHASVLQHISAKLRACLSKGTAVLAGECLIDFEPGDTTGQCYGLAFDIGTTTLVGGLLDLTDGRELAVTSHLNPQVSSGDDVLA
ncbi:MAG: 2Fe-2S iron-sulfur cluster binding domain-containing protein, partial [Planctomycetes bacterium]|nr:2Fe-2S iron-sulfur cluster binding domain-containing protein [Planctomycetota bacterium]